MPTHDLVYTGLLFPADCPDGGDGDTWGFFFRPWSRRPPSRAVMEFGLWTGDALSVQFVYMNPVISLLLPDVSRPCVLALGV